MTPFHTLAAMLRDHGIEAEAVTDAQGGAASVRFYVDGRAFNLVPTVDDDSRVRIEIEQYEAEEPETPEARLPHVLEVVRMTGLHADSEDPKWTTKSRPLISNSKSAR